METRKIQEVGGGTYTVSLPKEWADAQGLGAGSVVDLHTHIDDVLVVQPRDRGDDTARRALVQVDHDDADRLARTLRAAYVAGVAEVLFVAADSFTRDQRRTLGQRVGTLVGGTLDAESESRLLVRIPLDPEEVSVWQSIRHLEFVALSTHRESTASLLRGETVENARIRDDDADRLFAMIDRHLGRALTRLDEVDALGVTRSELFEGRTVARNLERVTDHATHIAATARHLDAPVEGGTRDRIRELSETARNVVEDATRCVLDDGDVATAHETLAVRDAVVDDCSALEARLFEDADRCRLARVVDRVRQTAELGGNIAELHLRVAVRRGRASDAEHGAGGNPHGTDLRPDGE